jgi:hypothetical protein
MTISFTVTPTKDNRCTNLFNKNYLITVVWFLSTFILLITSIIFAILWKNHSSFPFLNKISVENGIISFPPILPNDGKYIQSIILHSNDVFETWISSNVFRKRSNETFSSSILGKK